MNSPSNPQAKRHLGQILIDQGILTEDQLRIALLEQTKQHVPVRMPWSIRIWPRWR